MKYPIRKGTNVVIFLYCGSKIPFLVLALFFLDNMPFCCRIFEKIMKKHTSFLSPNDETIIKAIPHRLTA